MNTNSTITDAPFLRTPDRAIITKSPQRGTSLKRVPSGYYRYEPPFMTPSPILHPLEVPDSDKIIDLNTDAYQKVTRYVRMFFDPEVRARSLRFGVDHRMGILMHGKPGTGKTTIIKRMLNEVLKERDLVVLDVPHVNSVNDAINNVRIPANEPDRPIMIIFEEFDRWLRAGYEDELKTLLDGMESPDNLLVLATTNYITRIPKSLIDRPGRFAHVIKVAPFPLDVRKMFIARMLNDMALTEEERGRIDIELLAHITEDMTADHIRGIILDVLVYGTEFSSHVRILKEKTGYSADQQPASEDDDYEYDEDEDDDYDDYDDYEDDED